MRFISEAVEVAFDQEPALSKKPPWTGSGW